MAAPLLRFLRLRRRMSILEQLRLEEALLRHDSRNWCVLSALGSPSTVVLGCNGKAEVLLAVDGVKRDSVPVVRRFTGGGTVVVGRGTAVASLIANKADLASVKPFPRDIMAWTGEVYASAFGRLGLRDFGLRENDYVVDDGMKVAGNAQTIIKHRWLHHTSFLFDFDDKDMDYLAMPKNRPAYRRDRPHTDFITRIRPRLATGDIDTFVDGLDRELRHELSSSGFTLEDDDGLADRVLEDQGPSWTGNSRLLDNNSEF